jgi:hypothetical protein
VCWSVGGCRNVYTVEPLRVCSNCFRGAGKALREYSVYCNSRLEELASLMTFTGPGIGGLHILTIVIVRRSVGWKGADARGVRVGMVLHFLIGFLR